MSAMEEFEFSTVSVDFFVLITRAMTKHFGKNLTLSVEQMEQVRRAAAALESIGNEAKGTK